ncbi:ANTAR domain-containing protein [Nocardioides aurantiacus]|uniref:ANTAR domain-containing protein n=1 Tax=Nocardioides aurantiacus TaxID=86796 RepID=UPI00403F5BDD
MYAPDPVLDSCDIAAADRPAVEVLVDVDGGQEWCRGELRGWTRRRDSGWWGHVGYDTGAGQAHVGSFPVERIRAAGAPLDRHHVAGSDRSPAWLPGPRSLPGGRPPVNDDIARAIGRAAQQMGQATSVEEVLELIASSAAETLPAFDHVGVSTVEMRGEVQTRAATSDLVVELDRLQYRLSEGPCVDSLAGEDVVAAPDIEQDQRWPRYVPQAVERGLRSQLAVRLHLADRGTTGGLNLYSTTTDRIDPAEVSSAGLFAVHAALALGRAMESEALTAAVVTRQVIGQAIGILMERYQIDEKGAHAFLWRASSRGNVRVRDIAQRLVDEAASRRTRPD